MPRAFSEREKEVIRGRLREHGQRLFSRHGLVKTNVEELAAAAGISKGAFYGFYASKEALFMDIMEEIEARMRQEILAALDRPGPSPRSRLTQALKAAFRSLETTPMLQLFTGGDVELLFSRLEPGKLQRHLVADRAFLDELITRSRAAGIPIRINAQQLTELLYPLVLAVLHREDLGRQAFDWDVDVLLQLVAAYCLGEVRLEAGSPARRTERAK